MGDGRQVSARSVRSVLSDRLPPLQRLDFLLSSLSCFLVKKDRFVCL
jgi:hypothetical protein